MTLALNDAQRAAVEHPGGPLLVLAGAGSGKTRVLTARIAHLIKHRGVRPERIFAVTFTNKAAGEMRGRVATLLGAEPTGLWIGTFHSLDARLLRREAPLLGFGPNYTIYDEDDSQALIKRLLEARGHSPKVYPPRAVHSLISGAKNRMVTPDGFAADADSPLAQVTAEIYRALAAALQQANAMDFDDLLLHPLTLFAQHPERLAYWRRRFDHVLVDEFQDTNVAQYQLVKSLAAEHKNFCVVGDDDQAIYGWRGADVRHMLAFQDDFPGTTLVKLEQNYRSTQVILDLANAVIAENAGRLGKTLFTAKKGGERAIVLTAADERDEAQWLATELARLAADTDIPYEGMAILYRTNAQSRPLEEAFRFRGIPYRIVGAVSFYERREVKDLLAYLRIIANPADDEAFLRVVNVPRRGIGDASLQLLGQHGTRWAQPLLETARNAERIPELRPNVRDAFRGVAVLVDRLRQAAGAADPAMVLEQVLAVTGGDRPRAHRGRGRMGRGAGCDRGRRRGGGGGGRGWWRNCARALPHAGGVAHAHRRGRGGPRGHADDDAHGEGARVGGGGAGGARGRIISARAVGGAAGRVGRGTPVVLRGSHARARTVVSLLGADALSRWAPRARRAVPFPRSAAPGCRGGAQHHAVLGSSPGARPRRPAHAALPRGRRAGRGCVAGPAAVREG